MLTNQKAAKAADNRRCRGIPKLVEKRQHSKRIGEGAAATVAVAVAAAE